MSSLPLLVNPRSGGGFSNDDAKRLVELFRTAGAEPQLHLARSHDEILGIADRIAVIHAGRLTDARPAAAWTRAQIGLAMTGTTAEAEAVG